MHPADDQENVVAEGVDRNAEQRIATDDIRFYYPASQAYVLVKNGVQLVNSQREIKKKRGGLTTKDY